MDSDEKVTVICQNCGKKKELNVICPYCGAGEPTLDRQYQSPQQISPQVPLQPQIYPQQSIYGLYHHKKQKTFLNRQVEALGKLMGNVWTYIFLIFYFGILIFVAFDDDIFVAFVGWYSLMSYAAVFFLLAGAIPIVFTAWIMQKKNYSLPKIDNGLIQGLFGFVCVMIPLVNTYIYSGYKDTFMSMDVVTFSLIFMCIFLTLTSLALYIFSERSDFELKFETIFSLIFFAVFIIGVSIILSQFDTSSILGVFSLSSKSLVMITFFVMLFPLLLYTYLTEHRHVATIILCSSLFITSIFIYNMYWYDVKSYSLIYQVLFRLLVFGITDVIILYLINMSCGHGPIEVGMYADRGQLSNYALIGIVTPFFVYLIAYIGFVFANAKLSNITLTEFIVVFVISFVLAAFFEEFAFRGFIQTRLENGLGPWPGLILASILFGLAHLPTQTLGSGNVFVGLGLTFSQTLGGLMLGFIYKKTRSLIPCVISHGMWDFALFITIVAI